MDELSVYSQSQPWAQKKIREEMLKIARASVKKARPHWDRYRINTEARRLVHESLAEEAQLEQAESSNAEQPTIQ